ncbi:MAG: UDP-2,3-diacylglucosamine diphosphatase [Candidatus Cloacimonetes bacterium]|nr:UDP-2,3-diacylglucosamine diphosphatase [Candidatus Cloacimonadota bacterium]
MKYIIASDFHIKYTDRPKDIAYRKDIEGFFAGLVGKIDGLILAGDFFDFWMEWDSKIIKNYANICDVFRDLKNSGCRMIFLVGNHELWVGDYLANTVGFEVYRECFSEVINNKKIFISHGHQYIKKDFRYLFLKKLLSMKFVKSLAHRLPKRLSLFVADTISTVNPNSSKSQKIATYTHETLHEKAKEISSDYDLIVFGHSHILQQEVFDKCTYINCGLWEKDRAYCLFTEDNINIVGNKLL